MRIAGPDGDAPNPASVNTAIAITSSNASPMPSRIDAG